MEKIIWDKTFDTDIEIIDFQHKILVQRINDLKELYNNGSTQDNMFEIIVFLDGYANYHFSTEEAFFRSYSYKEEMNHIEQHQYFKKSIKEFKETYHNKKTKIDETLINFLSNWLINHILGTDKKFTTELKLNIIKEGK